MIKIALIGDASAQYYEVAQRIWELLSVLIGENISFSIKMFEKDEQVIAFLAKAKADATIRGLTILAPWKQLVATKLDSVEPHSIQPFMNAVYKDKQGHLIGANTDPVAAQKAIEYRANLYKCRTALVITENNSGTAYAQHLRDVIGLEVAEYDIVSALDGKVEIPEKQYDLILNTTPCNGYHSMPVQVFHSPLDLDMLQRLSHTHTIVQETSYWPTKTLLLQMAAHMGLTTVEGGLALVFRTTESLKRFLGVTLDEQKLNMLIDEVATGADVATTAN